MGYKIVCTKCRSSFSIGKDPDTMHSQNCRNCGKSAHLLHHKFKPPKKKAKKEWELVEFLIQNGFDFSSAYVPLIDRKNQFWGNLKVKHPRTIEEAKDFVEIISPNKKSR